MAGQVAVACSKIFPECAYVLTADADATNFPLWFQHLKDQHEHAAPVPPTATLNAALTYS